MTNINYSDLSMHGITYGNYNRLGVPETVTDAAGTRAFSYDLTGDLSLEYEKLPSSLLADVGGVNGNLRYLNYHYDTATNTKGRYTGMSFNNTSIEPSVSLYKTLYEYSQTTGQIDNITGIRGATKTKVQYGNFPDSSLIGQAKFMNASASDATLQTIDYDYEPTRDVLTSIGITNTLTDPDSALLSKYEYKYDKLGRRTNAYATGSHYSDYSDDPQVGLMTKYGYNNRSELTSIKQYFANSITDASHVIRGRSWDYGYDNAGNRITENRDTWDSQATWQYGNESNQLTQRVVPGQVSASGLISSGSSYGIDRVTLKSSIGGYDDHVTVQEVQQQSTQYQPAFLYQNFFSGEIDVNNAGNSVYAAMSVFATDTSTNTLAEEGQTGPAGYLFVPKTPEIYTYDNDGNLKTDGRWSYTFNSENQLTAMETRDLAYNQGVPRIKLVFKYDYQGRRFEKIVYSHNGSTFVEDTHTIYIYDGWNLIAELDRNNANAIMKRYYWGLDISGTVGGAGGAGGLIALVDSSLSGGDKVYLPQYDGNGNLIGWSQQVSGIQQVAATFEYTPFGEALATRYEDDDAAQRLSESGFRFGTQYYDAETGLYYYGYRYYSPDTGRFINRDPIGFNGGYNLYGFVGNNPVNGVDVRGLSEVSPYSSALPLGDVSNVFFVYSPVVSSSYSGSTISGTYSGSVGSGDFERPGSKARASHPSVNTARPSFASPSRLSVEDQQYVRDLWFDGDISHVGVDRKTIDKGNGVFWEDKYHGENYYVIFSSEQYEEHFADAGIVTNDTLTSITNGRTTYNIIFQGIYDPVPPTSTESINTQVNLKNGGTQTPTMPQRLFDYYDSNHDGVLLYETEFWPLAGSFAVATAEILRQNFAPAFTNGDRIFIPYHEFPAVKAVAAGSGASSLAAASLLFGIRPPNSTVVNQGGVRVVHFSQDHGPPHFHVYGKGPDTKIGQNGHPLKGQPALSPQQSAIIQRNLPTIRSEMARSMRLYRTIQTLRATQNASKGGR